MKTIILYKVVYYDSYNDYRELDFQNEADARTFANNYPTSHIYKYEVAGECTEVT